MPNIAETKEQQITQTPLILFDCILSSGSEEHWSTHAVTYDGKSYAPRVLRHNLFELRAGSDDGIDSSSRVGLTLANADSYFSQITANPGWKGARVTATFVFFNLASGVADSEAMVMFRGTANPPEDITEETLRVSFTSRLNLQRLLLPEVRIQRRCPWAFPSNAAQRQEAMDGGSRGKYSPFVRCGYSAGLAGGLGNLDGASPYTSCDYTRTSCETRGMFDMDSQNQVTRRFAGIEFVPASILVRGAGDKTVSPSRVVENEARYNDFVPMHYGTVWAQPPVVFARNDGNLTRMEVLLGAGEVHHVLKVIVNDIDIPEGAAGKDMTATGWYNVVSTGGVTGGFNLNFTDAAGNPQGDPYGSMAYLSLVVPNQVSSGKALAQVRVLMAGLKLAQYDAQGEFVAESFSNNPAWVLLDVLRRCGWAVSELDLGSFAAAASHCGQSIAVQDLYGNPATVARYQCNLTIRRRKSAADVVRGICAASGLYLVYGTDGKLTLRVEGTLTQQHSVKPAGSNAATQLYGGWPAYEFGDGTSGTSGILRMPGGESSVRLWSRTNAESPNRLSIEFQDEFNEYQQDSLSLVDVEDAVSAGQEISAAHAGLGVPNFHQAARMLQRQLDKAIRGNLYIQFRSSVKALGLRPGDIITVTYLKEGLQRQPFRVLRLAPGLNHRDALIEAQIHDDLWYTDVAGNGTGVSRRQPGSDSSVPRPLVGTGLDVNQDQQYGVEEFYAEAEDGSVDVMLAVSYQVPEQPGPSNIGIPYVPLAPVVDNTGGALMGGQTLYYGLTAVDANGGQSFVSFVVPASIPSGTNTNKVTLQGLRFSPGTVSFHVYRGETPQQMLRIAAGVAPAATFVDTGLMPQLVGPPDANFDHARFDWRLELHPEVTATIFGIDTIGNNTMQLLAGEFTGMTVRITAGKGKGQERVILSHTAATVTVKQKWVTVPDGTSKFVLVESGWRAGASSRNSPVHIDVPNRDSATVHIMGRAVNAEGAESSYELSPVTRWTILGAAGAAIDTDVPPPPAYGLNPTGQGTLEVQGIGFNPLTNTRSISAGTLTVHFWNELAGAPTVALAGPVDGIATSLTLNTNGGASIGDLIQIGQEVMEIEEVGGGGTVYTVLRGSHGSTAAAHASGAAVFHLDRKVFIMPFHRDFFGSPASGSFSYPVFLPDVRVAASDFMVTNSRGNSETSKSSYTATTNSGIRTLSGGQFNMQVEGFLAIQTSAAPALVIETAHSVGDIFATVTEAPTGAPIQVQIKKDGVVYASLTIPSGATISNVVDGFALPPLNAMSKLTLDIVSVGQTYGTTTGRDLTVTIRL